MTIWIARPKLYLPARLQKERAAEFGWQRWSRRFWFSAAAGVLTVALNSLGLSLALHGAGDWAVLPAAASAIPLLWLVDAAIWRPIPLAGRPEYESPASDLIELIRP